MSRRFLAALVSLFVVVCMQHAVCGEAALQSTKNKSLCESSSPSWDCYGELEISISMVAVDESKLIPFSCLQVRHFSNEELRVESNFFPDKSTKIYFFAMPSRVELFQGWELSERPFDIVLTEQTPVIKILRAAFPSGPKSIGRQRQAAVAQVTKYVYPIGDRKEKISVIAHRTDEGEIQIQFNDFGEPIGPYQVFVTWKAAQPTPLHDDYPITQAKNKIGLRFEHLGDARRTSLNSN
jgi:hypothetical protein